MNREVNDLVLVLSSAVIGAVIAFLAALVTFTFYHKIRELLLFRGLIVPINEPRTTNTTAQACQEPRQHNEAEENRQGNPPFLLFAAHGDYPRLSMARLLPNYQGNPNRHLWPGDFPAAFTAW